ncbi:type III secretion protein HrpB4 [Roseateles amylovorans]|uniref:Type III secretion protein HrpB4 n=1 Tax=Roseateles amylovorans TaxID=2978473 RepID=A0ABY6B0C2_9BURK|nr:type III secretion protein HrpB4 [Roseateles amylovorans]UXH78285.1 hypothetical protein N4261_25610 [Roseateles amylovorans]
MVTAEQQASWALAFGHKLQGLIDDLDAEWREEVMTPWAFVDAMPEADARRLMPRLWSGRLRAAGGLPRLRRFADPLTRLCLLPRGDLLHRLCTIALARRPGVLRCCIDRSVRAPLQRALGDSFDALAAMSRSGKPVDAATANWSPVVWACVGFADWSAQLAPEDDAVRQIVQLSMPRTLLADVLAQPDVPADRGVTESLAALADAGVNWPC